MASSSVARQLVVAIDGTSGAGKSSTSRRVAQKLGLRYLDTGAMYRAMTWALLQQQVDFGNSDEVALAAAHVELTSGTNPEHPEIWVGDREVSHEIRQQDVTDAVSLVSAVPEVRAKLLAEQREEIGEGGIIVEGRDIGTTVVPWAPVKVYLSADAAARAARRAAESGRDEQSTRASLLARDKIDSTRKASPLVMAADATHIDTSHFSLEQVVDQILSLCLKVNA
jgi:CMP/dCMP kinase